MEHKLTVTVPEEVYQPLVEEALRQGRTPEEEASLRLQRSVPIKKPKGKDLSPEQKAFNHDLSAIRVHIEHCIGWLKNWAILANRFRCAHAIYTPIFQLVCGLVNAQTQRWQSRQPYCA